MLLLLQIDVRGGAAWENGRREPGLDFALPCLGVVVGRGGNGGGDGPAAWGGDLLSRWDGG